MCEKWECLNLSYKIWNLYKFVSCAIQFLTWLGSSVDGLAKSRYPVLCGFVVSAVLMAVNGDMSCSSRI